LLYNLPVFSDFFRFLPLVLFIISAVVDDLHVFFPVGKKIAGVEICDYRVLAVSGVSFPLIFADLYFLQAQKSLNG